MLICFLGIDGSGKTRYALSVINHLKTRGINCKYIHFHAVLINKMLAISSGFRYIRYSTNNREIATENCDLDNRIDTRLSHDVFKFIKNGIYLILLIFDNFLFYLKNKNFLKKENNIIICDRYFYDTLATISRVKLAYPYLGKLYFSIFPSPDIIILIDILPEIAFMRKNEDSLEYLINQREGYLRIFPSFPCTTIRIDSSEEFESSITKLLIKLKPYLMGESK